VSEKQETLSFCLLWMDDTSDLEEAFKKIQSIPEVKHCDPVRTRYHMVAQIGGSSIEEIELILDDKIRKIPHIQVMDLVTSEFSNLSIHEKDGSEGNGKAKLVSSFVLCEADKQKLSHLSSNLEKIPFVTAWYQTRGCYDLVAQMKAPSFVQLHRSLTGDIRPLEGIVRCWMLDVINIDQL